MRLPAEIERAEREKVASRKPWLAFSRAEPVTPAKPRPDHFVFHAVADLVPVEISDGL